MTLLELAQQHPAMPCPAVPEWTMGCFRRRSITYFSGETDTSTQVYWLQSGRLCADFRFGLPGHIEAGVAHASWDGVRMRWSDWTALADRDKWPEPGELRRIGNCLMEFAPSGAYVKYWRPQTHQPGLLAGLRLLDETDSESGEVLHVGGGLVVCDQHIALVRGGREFSAAYGRRNANNSVSTILSTGDADPGWDLDGFACSAAGVTQTLFVDGRPEQRRYPIDRLAPRFAFPHATAVTAAGSAWLAQEADTLLAQVNICTE